MTDALSISPEDLLQETRWLQSLAASLAGPVESDDLAQTTWLRALEQERGRVRGLRPWLRTVLHHAFLRTQRERRARQARERAAARRERVASAADLAQRTMLHRSVADAVLALEEPARSTVLLRFFEDLPPREISRIQGVPVATVRTRLRRALLALRSRLDGEFGDRTRWVSALSPLAAARVATTTAAAAAVLCMATGTKAWIAAACLLLISTGVGIAWFARGGGDVPPAVVPIEERQDGRESGRADRIASKETPAGTPVAATPYVEQDGPAGDFVISGRVLDAKTRTPLSDVIVSSASGEGERAADESVRSHAAGRFEMLTRHPTYQFAVDLFRQDYARLELTERDLHGRSPEANRFDLGDVLMERGAELRGRVVDEAGAPVADAKVTMISRRNLWRDLTRFGGSRLIATTASDGAFVASERVACDEKTPERMLLAQAGDRIGWGWVAVAPAAETVAPITITVLRGRSVRVRVEDESRQPLAGIGVLAHPCFQPLGLPREQRQEHLGWPVLQLDAAIRDRFQGRTGADGTITFAALPIGSHEDDQRRGHWGYEWLDRYELVAGAEGCDPARVYCNITGEHDDPVVLTLRRMRHVTLIGSVLDRNKKPIPHAKIDVNNGSMTAETDEAGAYSVSGIPSQWDRTPVVASAEGFGSRTLDMHIPETGETAKRDFVLLRGLPVKGRFIDESGTLVPGWSVSLQNHRDQTQRIGKTVKNAFDDGTFEFEGVPEGEWAVWVTTEEKIWEMPPTRTIQAGDVAVDIVVKRRPTETTTVIVDVVEASTGALADMAEARMWKLGPHVDTYRVPEAKREKGRVTFTDAAPGSWEIRVRTAEGRKVARAIEITGKEKELRLRLEIEEPGAILGRLVLDAIPESSRPDRIAVVAHADGEGKPTTLDGKPVEGIVGAFNYANRADGWRFRFADFTPGRRVRILVIDDDLYGFAEVAVKAGADAPVDVKVVATAKVELRVANPPADAQLILFMRRPDGPPVRLDWQTNTKVRKVSVPSGSLAWRAELAILEPGGAERSVRVLEGDLKLEPGETKPLPLDFSKP